MSKEQLLVALEPILKSLGDINVDDPVTAVSVLQQRWPLSSLLALKALVRAGVAERWLCDKENAGVRFSRVVKAAAADAFSVDAVHMQGAALGHTHPNGEIDLCFGVDDKDSAFDGHAEGWTVYGKNTWHVPTVSGGAMDILYFLPGGAIRFEDKPTQAT